MKQIVKVNEVMNLNVQEYPSGWLVRERVMDGKTMSLEYGAYVDNDVFVSVPLHFSFKDVLIPMTKASSLTDKYNYYALPQDVEVGISKYTNRRTGKVCPLLVPVSQKFPAVLVASLAFDCGTESVLSAAIDDDRVKVIRKYIDKNRKALGIIAFFSDDQIVNPGITINVNTGVIGDTTVTNKKYAYTMEGESTTTDVNSVEDGNTTQFIKFNEFIINKKPQETESDESSDLENKNV